MVREGGKVNNDHELIPAKCSQICLMLMLVLAKEAQDIMAVI
jgi:hypothetical protein